MHCINYAHRGASDLYPENTLYSFYMGLNMGADGIETDIQRTKDGVLVLFHDKTLTRIVGRDETIQDFSYAELLQMDFGSHKGAAFANEKIVTLEEFLRHFGEKSLELALEIKQKGIEREVLAMVNRFGVSDKVTMTSFEWDSVVAVRRENKSIRVGYLTRTVTPELLKTMRELSIMQICPQVDSFDAEMLRLSREMGFSVRFWGIGASEEKMRKALLMGADGMTINAPDLLTKALNEA